MAHRATLDTINDFLAQKRIAMVGISRDPAEFSGFLFRELTKRGYDVVPVNPAATEIQGKQCFARVQDIQPPVEAALLITPPAVTESVARDCAQAGVRRVWMHRGGGQGAVSDTAVEFCGQHGMQVIPGECPFMFFPKPGLHGIHGFLRKMVGAYPRRAQTPAA